jgi:hypothetical protein
MDILTAGWTCYGTDHTSLVHQLFGKDGGTNSIWLGYFKISSISGERVDFIVTANKPVSTYDFNFKPSSDQCLFKLKGKVQLVYNATGDAAGNILAESKVKSKVIEESSLKSGKVSFLLFSCRPRLLLRRLFWRSLLDWIVGNYGCLIVPNFILNKRRTR